MREDPILSLAVVFVLGFLFSRLVKKLKIPTITAYVALGILLSPDLLNLISTKLFLASEFFSNIVLGMIAFSLGESFSLRILRRIGKSIISISIGAAVGAWFLVAFVFLFIFKQPFYIALIFGAISAATAPAATVMVTQEYKSRGNFTNTLLGIVAIDDVWAVIIFALSLSLAKSFLTHNNSILEVFRALSTSFIEIAGSFLVGGLVAVAFNRFCHLIRSVKERLIYTFGFLFLAIGLANYLNFSILLACMSMGAVLVNTNRLSSEFFDSLREIDTPLYLIFFVLAGASLKIDVLLTGSILVLAFIISRTLGKYLGAFLGAKVVDAPLLVKKYMGLALIPQAGVALACALIAKHTLSNAWGNLILTITIATTVVFELFGPSVTKFSLSKAGEIRE